MSSVREFPTILTPTKEAKVDLLTEACGQAHVPNLAADRSRSDLSNFTRLLAEWNLARDICSANIGIPRYASLVELLTCSSSQLVLNTPELCDVMGVNEVAVLRAIRSLVVGSIVKQIIADGQMLTTWSLDSNEVMQIYIAITAHEISRQREYFDQLRSVL